MQEEQIFTRPKPFEPTRQHWLNVTLYVLGKSTPISLLSGLLWGGYKWTDINLDYLLLIFWGLYIGLAFIDPVIDNNIRNPLFADAWYDDPDLQERRRRYEKTRPWGQVVLSLLWILGSGYFLLMDWKTSFYHANESVPDWVHPVFVIGTILLGLAAIGCFAGMFTIANKMEMNKPIFKNAKRNKPPKLLKPLNFIGLLLFAAVATVVFLWFGLSMF